MNLFSSFVEMLFSFYIRFFPGIFAVILICYAVNKIIYYKKNRNDYPLAKVIIWAILALIFTFHALLLYFPKLDVFNIIWSVGYIVIISFIGPVIFAWLLISLTRKLFRNYKFNKENNKNWKANLFEFILSMICLIIACFFVILLILLLIGMITS